MTRLKSIAALLTATALRACAVGPHYQAPPPVAAGQGTSLSAPPTVAPPDAPPAQSPRLFPDPTLPPLAHE